MPSGSPSEGIAVVVAFMFLPVHTDLPVISISINELPDGSFSTIHSADVGLGCMNIADAVTPLIIKVGSFVMPFRLDTNQLFGSTVMFIIGLFHMK